MIKETTVDTIAKDPILECVHKDIEKCHYTYVTQFTPAQEEGKSEFNYKGLNLIINSEFFHIEF